MFLDSVSSLSYVILIFFEDRGMSANVLYFGSRVVNIGVRSFLSGFLSTQIFYDFRAAT